MTDLREFFENILLRQHRELLQECINIDVLDQFIRSRESYSSTNAGLFWLAHAAALILSGQWLEDKVSSDPVIVRLDALWNEIYRDLAEAIEAAATTTLAKAKFLRPAPMRSLSILEGLRLFASQPFRQRFQPQAFVLGTEPYDAARHTLSVEVQPAPAELSLKVQGSELTIQLEPRKQGTHWVVLSLGAWLDIAGSETTFSVRTRKNRGPSSGIAYVALEKFDTKDRVYPQTSLCQIGAEWSEFSIGLAASPELGRPRDQVQVWLPIGDGQGTVIFDSIEWHVQRWVAPGSPMIEAMADCGSTFSKTLEAKFRNGMKHRHVSPELLEDELRHLRISAGGIEVSFSDVMRNKDSWLKMQAAVAAEIGSGIGDAGLVLVEIYRRLYAAALAVLDLVPHGRRERGDSLHRPTARRVRSRR
jgi:hypothetical protein